MMATQLLVVPRSIPITSPASVLLNLLEVISAAPLNSETLFLDAVRERLSPN